MSTSKELVNTFKTNTALKNFIHLALLMFNAIFSINAFAGPFPPGAGEAGTTAIHANDSSISGWATGVADYSMGSNVDLEWQVASRALLAAGDSDGDNSVAAEDYIFDIVSLGRGGSITLTFDNPITNGAGFDFAVFENAFEPGFLELAWVEVSSNGIDYARFPAASLTPGPVSSFAGTMDPDDIDGLAGKYVSSYGTPFDLDDLPANPNVDTNSITHVRLVDIVGDGSAIDDLTAPDGPNIIYDPYPTAGSAGFDLDAVAVIHFQETSTSVNVPFPMVFIFGLATLLTLISQNRKSSLK